MKTCLFQASAAYLPEDFIRVGQLTKRVDIFGCGIVRASFSVQFWACTHLPFPWLLCKQIIEALRNVPPSTAGVGKLWHTGQNQPNGLFSVAYN